MSASTVERRPRPAAAAARPAAAEGGASNSSGRPFGVPALALAAPAAPATQLPLPPPRLPPAAVRAAIVITGDPSPERPAGRRRRRDDGGGGEAGAAPAAPAAAAQGPATAAAAAAPPPKKPRTAAAPKKKAKPRKKKTLTAKARRAAVLGVVAAVEAAKAAGAPAPPPGGAAAAPPPAAAGAPPAAADVRNRNTAWTKRDTQELARLLEDPAAMAAALPGAPPSTDQFSDADWERLSRRFGRFSPAGAAVKAQALAVGRLARAARRLGPRGAHYADLAAEALAAAPGRRGTAVDVQRWLLASRRRDLDTYPTKGGAAAYKAIVREALAERPERFRVVGKTPAGLRLYALAEDGGGEGGGGGDGGGGEATP
jgi:hypothetical protein